MLKLQKITTLLFILNIKAIYTLQLHQFYALEKTDVVSTSTSIREMNKCKDSCLIMKKYFPFKFKYHRYILRENVGSNKYFQGNCLFAFKGEDQWYGWDKLKVFITETTTAVDMSQVQRWTDYKDKCEDETLKLDQQTLNNLNFKRVHSNFEYYDDGTFNNIQPFTDLQELMDSVSGFIK